ncbi:hypothetical protein [Vibrio sp. S9_S30]|nr:hypothetical protein [Vibrio sp. S9_S30]
MNIPYMSFEEFCQKLDCDRVARAVERVEDDPTLLLDEAFELDAA